MAMSLDPDVDRWIDAEIGPLERDIMDVLWDLGSATVKEVLEVLSSRIGRQYAYNTIMSTMARLAEKGYVDRFRVGKAYVYQATSPEEFAQRVFGQNIRRELDLLGDDVGLRGIVQVLSPEDVRVLQQMLYDTQQEGTEAA